MLELPPGQGVPRGQARDRLRIDQRPRAGRRRWRSLPASAPGRCRWWCRGSRFVFAQDLGDLARFIGVEFDGHAACRRRSWCSRLDLILAATQRYLGQFHERRPGRGAAGPRTQHPRPRLPHLRDPGGVPRRSPRRAAHLRLLRAHAGPRHAERGPGRGLRADRARRAPHRGGASADAGRLGTLDTYYGIHPTERVLERTAWHAAQHARQIMALLGAARHRARRPPGRGRTRRPALARRSL